jgi:hypothetical protein
VQFDLLYISGVFSSSARARDVAWPEVGLTEASSVLRNSIFRATWRISGRRKRRAAPLSDSSQFWEELRRLMRDRREGNGPAKLEARTQNVEGDGIGD